MNPAFWKDKRVFLTGHTGFKGAWLSFWLAEMGAKVTGYALPPHTEPSLFNEISPDMEINSISGDIRDLNALAAALEHSKAEIVIHMAAQALVRDGYDDPVNTYSTNVMGTVNILEACRKTKGIRAILIITTDKCYENNEWVWGYRENEPMGGHDPYSSSKGCAELVVSAYRRSYELIAATARAGNVIGGGDWSKNRLLPDIIRAVLSGSKVELRNPEAIRPWQHVLDCLHGYLTLCEALYERGQAVAEGFNFGPYEFDAKTVAWMLERFLKCVGLPPLYDKQPGNHPHEARYLKLDISKAVSTIGWKPVWNAEKAIDMTAQWLNDMQAGKKISLICQTQIQEFMDAAAKTLHYNVRCRGRRPRRPA